MCSWSCDKTTSVQYYRMLIASRSMGKAHNWELHEARLQTAWSPRWRAQTTGGYKESGDATFSTAHVLKNTLRFHPNTKSLCSSCRSSRATSGEDCSRLSSCCVTAFGGFSCGCGYGVPAVLFWALLLMMFHLYWIELRVLQIKQYIYTSFQREAQGKDNIVS